MGRIPRRRFICRKSYRIECGHREIQEAECGLINAIRGLGVLAAW